ncbi:hypothetical protein TNCV_4243011 [Trichonephila clavipes]|nr:hypothetical protein TNCV_4243011 [Trichonephila clavipes]
MSRSGCQSELKPPVFSPQASLVFIYRSTEGMKGVRNRCLHLATGRTRDDKRKGSGNDREKGRNGGEKEKRVAKKPGVVKSRHGWTMYLNLVTHLNIFFILRNVP